MYFEDATTIRYQIQEMLRIERVFEPEGIEEELSAYNPLIPDGQNWKATFMIEIPDPAQRAIRLGEMIGIEDQVWLQVGELDRIVPIADEDLDRTTADKTALSTLFTFRSDAGANQCAKGWRSAVCGH